MGGRHAPERVVAFPGMGTPHVIGPIAAHIVLPWIYRLFSNFKRWAMGVFHGLRRPHLQTYLDEFVFRFNRRKNRPSVFRSLFTLAMRKSEVPYAILTQPEARV